MTESARKYLLVLASHSSRTETAYSQGLCMSSHLIRGLIHDCALTSPIRCDTTPRMRIWNPDLQKLKIMASATILSEMVNTQKHSVHVYKPSSTPCISHTLFRIRSSSTSKARASPRVERSPLHLTTQIPHA